MGDGSLLSGQNAPGRSSSRSLCGRDGSGTRCAAPHLAIRKYGDEPATDDHRSSPRVDFRTEPDEMADQGWYQFTYSLLPHSRTYRDSEVIHEAYASMIRSSPGWPLRTDRETFH